MEDIKTSKAQLKAVKNWEDKNKEKVSYTKSKSACKSFIKNKATLEDIQDIEELIREVKKNKYNNL